MGYTKGLWQGMFGGMSGAVCRADKICFRTVAEGAATCTLLLFEKGNTEPGHKISMTRIGNSTVFYAEVTKKELLAYDTYLFADENGTFSDNYATHVSGRDEFGKQEGCVCAALPKKESYVVKEDGFVCPAFSDLIFYKLHVRGFTKHASSGVKKKGTFAGLTEKIPYLKELGINAVLLMPVYEFDECKEVSYGCGCLSAKQLAQYEARYGSEFVKVQQSYEKNGMGQGQVDQVNYWGYTPNNFYFAPKASYAAEPDKAEAELVKTVQALHEAGIAVFFEFFFGEGTKKGFILDCLRYWTYVYGADGFRLVGGEDALPFLLEDAYLSGVKFLVTSPQGTGPALTEEGDKRCVAAYNDGFRNVMRRFVKGDENVVAEFAGLFCREDAQCANVQYIADQNGFSLYDLYAYDRKHNEQNGEDNKDGEEYNHSWNCGIEGETTKKKIVALRSRLRKNALCTVLLSQGVPMLFAGDEFGQTKQGNNNAYCQDNEISWLNWRWNKERKDQFGFTKELIACRKAYSGLFGGRLLRGSDWKNLGMPDLSYHGVALWQPDYAPYSRTVSVLLSSAYGRKTQEADLYFLFNMHWEELQFALPMELSADKRGEKWETVIDTSGEAKVFAVNEGKQVAFSADESLTEHYCKVPARTIVVLHRKKKMTE